MEMQEAGQRDRDDNVQPLKKLILHAALPTTIGTMTIAIVASLIAILVLGLTSGDTSRAILREQMETNLVRSVNEAAATVQQQFLYWQRTSSVNVAEAMAHLYPRDATVSFYNVSADDALFDLGDSLELAQQTQKSVFYVPFRSTFNVSALPDTSVARRFITASQELDTFFRAAVRDNPSLAAIYIGCDNPSGRAGGAESNEPESLFRRYPPLTVDESRVYDPRERPWYKATESSEWGNAVSSAYVDAFGLGWMVTVSQRRAIADGLVCVSGADITIDSLNEEVRRTVFGATGYAMLAESDAAHRVIAHPQFTATENTDNPEAEAPSVASLESDVPAPVLEKPFGETVYESAGFLWAAMDFDGLIYAAKVPLAEVIAPADEVASLAAANTGIEVAIVVLLGLALSGVAFYLIHRFVARVVRDVALANEVADTLTRRAAAGNRQLLEPPALKFADVANTVADLQLTAKHAVEQSSKSSAAQPNPVFWAACRRPWRIDDEARRVDIPAVVCGPTRVNMPLRADVKVRPPVSKGAVQQLFVPLCLLVFALCVTAVVVVGFLHGAVVARGEAVATDESLSQLVRSVTAKAALVNNVMEENLAQVRLHRDLIEAVVRGQVQRGAADPFVVLNPEPSFIKASGSAYQAKTRATPNFSAMTWYAPGILQPSQVTPALDAELELARFYFPSARTIRFESKAFVDSSGKVMSVYSGNERTGLYTVMPFERYDPPLSAAQLTSARDGRTFVGYDPRERVWYVNASSAADAVVAAPYLDVNTNELIVTVAARVTTADTALHSVAAIDLSAAGLYEALFEDEYAGYAYVIDERNTVLLHADADQSKVQSLLDVEFESEREKERFEDLLLDTIDEHVTRPMEFKRDADVHYAVIGSVAAAKWRLGMVVSASDADEVAGTLRASFTSAVVVLCVLFFVVLVPVTLVVLYVRRRRVVMPVRRPLREIREDLEMIRNVGVVDTREQDDGEAKATELEEFRDTYQGLATALLFAHPHSASLPAEDRLKVYRGARNLFEPLGDSSHAISVCYNNESYALLELDRRDEAVEAAEAAVLHAVTNVRELRGQQDGVRYRDAIATEVRRRVALSSLLEEKSVDQALTVIRQGKANAERGWVDASVELLVREAELLDVMAAKGLKASLKSSIGGGGRRKRQKSKRSEALRASDSQAAGGAQASSLELLRVAALTANLEGVPACMELSGLDVQNVRAASHTPIAVYDEEKFHEARARSLVRLAFARRADTKDAARVILIGAALESGPFLSADVARAALTATDLIGDAPERNRLRSALLGGVLGAFGDSAPPMNILVVLDASGSMAGGRMKAAHRNILTIFDEHVHGRDLFSFIVYSTRTKAESVRTRIEAQRVPESEAARRQLRRRLEANVKAQGQTPSYDALLRAYQITKSRSNDSKQPSLICFLTDGADNKSDASVADVKRMIRANKDVALVVITVFAEAGTEAVWSDIIDDAEKHDVCVARHLVVHRGEELSKLDEAFAEAAGTINAVRGIESV